MPDVQRRAARRTFISTHHPDRGGDSDAFIEGLRRLSDTGTHPAPVTFYRRPRGLRRLVRPSRRLVRFLTRSPTPPRVR